MKPVFRSNKRSYSTIPAQLESPGNISKLNTSENPGLSTNNVSPDNEYLGETAGKLQVDPNDEEGGWRGSSHMRIKNESF